MKKILFVILVMAGLVSCADKLVTFSDLNPSEYGNFIYTPTSSAQYLAGSPVGYSVIVGQNPANEYSWTTVEVRGAWQKAFVPGGNWIFKGDENQLIKAYYKDADVILLYNSYYYIGYKKK